MENNRIQNSFRNMVYGLLKYGVTFIFPFILRTLIILKLGLEYVGVNSLFSSILQVLSLSELGFSTAIIYSLYNPVAKNDKDKICNILSFYRKAYRTIGIVILFVGLMLCPFLPYLINGEYPCEINIYIIYILLLINTAISYLLCGYKSTLFIVYQRSDMTSKTELISSIVMYLLQILSLVFLKNYYVFVVSMIIGTVINNMLMLHFSKKMFPELKCCGDIEKKEKKSMAKKIVTLFGHQLDMVIINSSDSIIISRYLGLYVLGLYGNYLTIVNALMAIIRMISNSFLASIGNSIALETKEKNYNNLKNFTYLINSIAGICAIIMFCVFQDFITIWLGKTMLLDDGIILLLCFYFYFRLFKRPGNTYKEAMGLWNADFLKPYIAGISNLILNIIFVRKIGLYGVIISTIISLVLIEMPWETFVLFRYYFDSGCGDYVKLNTRIFVKMLLIGFVSYQCSRMFSCHTIIDFAFKLIFVSVLSVLLFFTLSFKDVEFKYTISKLKEIIR